jgi:hypothetical protein
MIEAIARGARMARGGAGNDMCFPYEGSSPVPIWI